MNEQFDYIEELMLASLSSRISEKDQDFLNEMIEADEEVAELWKQHVLIASRLKKSVRKQLAWNRIQRTINREKGVISQPKTRWRVSLVLALVLMIVSSIYFLNGSRNNLPEGASNSKQDNLSITFDNTTIQITSALTNTSVAEITTINGEVHITPKTTRAVVCRLHVPKKRDTKILLADGTRIWINAASELSFPLAFNTTSRDVTLTGEAYFEVAHKDAQPFIVSAGGMKVEVKGTHFNIRAYPNEKIETSLSQGSVSVEAGKQTRLLVPGEKATLDQTGLQVAAFDSSNVLSWINGTYRFNNELLDEINPVFDRWFGYTFHFEDQSLKDIRFSGLMDRKQPLDSFLNRLCQSANLKYTYDRLHINLSRI